MPIPTMSQLTISHNHCPHIPTFSFVVLLAGLGRAVPPRCCGDVAVGDVAEDAVGPRDGDWDAAARNTWIDHYFLFNLVLNSVGVIM